MRNETLFSGLFCLRDKALIIQHLQCPIERENGNPKTSLWMSSYLVLTPICLSLDEISLADGIDVPRPLAF